MFQALKTTFIGSTGWKIPVNCAVSLHLAVILGTVYLPQLLQTKPLFPDIYSVDLINISEEIVTTPETQPETPEVTDPLPESVPEPKKIPEKAIPIVEKNADVAPVVVESRPVSIKPLMKKVVKTIPPQKVERPQKKLEELNKRHIEEALAAEKVAREAARIAAMEAVTNLKQMIRETESIQKSTQATAEKSSPRPVHRTVDNVVKAQYFASVSNRLHSFWALPEHKKWDPSLNAVIVIQIEKDGTISNQFFEKKSGDRLFDQFAIKTLQDASPLPVIPTALQVDKIEIGFRFLPGGIQF